MCRLPRPTLSDHRPTPCRPCRSSSLSTPSLHPLWHCPLFGNKSGCACVGLGMNGLALPLVLFADLLLMRCFLHLPLQRREDTSIDPTHRDNGSSRWIQHYSAKCQPCHPCKSCQGQWQQRSRRLGTRSIFGFIFWDSRHTCWTRIRSVASTSEYPFALITAGIESLVSGFASQARKKRADFFARSSTFYLFEDMLKC
jgi:hypothetical protein